jgi:hypothetical protein
MWTSRHRARRTTWPGPGALLKRKTTGPVRAELSERIPAGAGRRVDWTALWREIGIAGDPPDDLVWLGDEVGEVTLVAPEDDEEWSGIDIALLGRDDVIFQLGRKRQLADNVPDEDDWPVAPDPGGLVPFAVLGQDGAVWSYRTGPDPAVVATESGEQGAWSPGSVTGFLRDVLAGKVEEACGIAPADARRLTAIQRTREQADGRQVAEANPVTNTIARLRKRRK